MARSDRWVLTPRGERVAALLYGAGIVAATAGLVLAYAFLSYLLPE